MSYAVIQNNVIIDMCDSLESAKERIVEEKQKDLVSIMFKRSLRKLFKKDPSNIALHSYKILHVVDIKEVSSK